MAEYYASSSQTILSRRFLETSAAPDHHFDPSTIPSSATEAFTVPLSPETFHGHRIEVPEASVQVTKEDLLWMYTNMVRMRRMEQVSLSSR